MWPRCNTLSNKHKRQRKVYALYNRRTQTLGLNYTRSALVVLLLIAIGIFAVFSRKLFVVEQRTIIPSTSFIASVDTMKVSRDTQRNPLPLSKIKAIVQLAASLNTNYITVDTNWDYPDYTRQWIDAIRESGRHVWFRTHPNQWENDNGAVGIMSPAQLKIAERTFITTHISFFSPGDIFDPCSEPEQGHYWSTHYYTNWVSHAPNAATREYNAFLRDTTDIANTVLHQQGIYGVITTIRSTNSFFATHPDVLEQATVNKFGRITVDSYPERQLTEPKSAVQARLSELQTIENIWHVPIIIGEMGYSNDVPVDDVVQQNVLKAEFAALTPLSYLTGVNYWVGPGSVQAGGYTYIFVNSGGKWSFRPAAYELTAFYKMMLGKRAFSGGSHGAYT